MGKEKLNTHYYDGKLKDRYKVLVEEIRMDVQVDIQDLEATVGEIIDYIETQSGLDKPTKLKALRMIQTLQSDTGNWDSANEIDARVLLRYVWHRVRDYDPSGKALFLEQVLDIYNGQCPQGRTTRLLQCVPTLRVLSTRPQAEG